VSGIQQIIKSSEKVRALGQTIEPEVPALIAKACELFAADLAARAWRLAAHAYDGTLQRLDVSAAIKESDMFEFLLDEVVPLEDIIVLHNPSYSSSSSDGGNKRRKL
jgi:nuclear transcription factor Y gamma